MEYEGEGKEEKRKGPGKYCLWIERRQSWHIGKWWFTKVKKETPC